MLVVAGGAVAWVLLAGNRSTPDPATTGAVATSTVVQTLRIDPAQWDARETAWDVAGPAFESGATIARYGATHLHAYGRDIGQFSYVLFLDKAPLTAEVRARLSSEFPNYEGPAGGFSDVVLIVNGVQHPAVRVIPDNGSGEWYAWSLASTELHEGANQLTFAVLPGAGLAHGLCIYGRAAADGQEDAAIEVTVSG